MNWEQTYIAMRGQWVNDRGIGAQGRTGAALPKMHAHDPFFILAAVIPAVVSTIKRAIKLSVAEDSRTRYAYDSPVAVAYRGTSAGEYFTARLTAPATGARLTVSIEEWLGKGKAMGSDALVRYVPVTALPGAAGDLARAPFHVATGETESVRQVVSKYQRVVDLAARAMAGATRFPSLEPSTITEYWSAWYQLCIALDISGEIPEDDVLATLRGAARQAAEGAKEIARDAANLAGQAAGEILQLAGEAAGKGLGGFFQGAGLTALAIAGVAVYVALN